MPDSRHEFGRVTETRAVQFYERRGAHVLEQNRRYRFGEIDLIVEEPGVFGWELVFVEVRARSSGGWVDGVTSVTTLKRQRLSRAIRAYLANYRGSATQVRVDLLAWDGRAWEHLENAWSFEC